MRTVVCPKCSEPMRRSRRRFFETFFFTAAYRCDDCRLRVRVSRLATLKKLRFAACPRCGNFSLQVLSRRDFIDPMVANPFRILMGQLRARLYHCRGCRLQFYDLRHRMPVEERKAKLEPSAR